MGWRDVLGVCWGRVSYLWENIKKPNAILQSASFGSHQKTDCIKQSVVSSSYVYIEIDNIH